MKVVSLHKIKNYQNINISLVRYFKVVFFNVLEIALNFH